MSSIAGNILFVLTILSAIMVYLTYSPLDQTYFWIYWFTVTVFLFFGYLMDWLFCDQYAFIYDPNIENWKRKTDPRD